MRLASAYEGRLLVRDETGRAFEREGARALGRIVLIAGGPLCRQALNRLPLDEWAGPTEMRALPRHRGGVGR